MTKFGLSRDAGIEARLSQIQAAEVAKIECAAPPNGVLQSGGRGPIHANQLGVLKNNVAPCTSRDIHIAEIAVLKRAIEKTAPRERRIGQRRVLNYTMSEFTVRKRAVSSVPLHNGLVAEFKVIGQLSHCRNHSESEMRIQLQ